MPKFKVTWEERYSVAIEANSIEEAKEKWENFTETEMRNCYDETVFFDVETE